MRFEVGPIAGKDLQTLVEHIYALPPQIGERARQALVYKPPAH